MCKKARQKTAKLYAILNGIRWANNNQEYTEMTRKKIGKLVLNNIPLRRHESKTISLLLSYGYDINLIPKSNKKGVQTPDFKMNGLKWEMKSPCGKGKWLIKNTLQTASHQSENIVLDLRRIKIHPTRCMSEVKRHFSQIKRIKRIKIITKSAKIIDLDKLS